MKHPINLKLGNGLHIDILYLFNLCVFLRLNHTYFNQYSLAVGEVYENLALSFYGAMEKL